MIFKRRKKELELFDHPTINLFEKEVADTLQTAVYSDNKSILKEFTRTEIEQSKLSTELIFDHFVNDRELLKKFTIRAYTYETGIYDGEEYPPGEEPLESEKSISIESHGPGIGFGITHAIYFHFLKHGLNRQLSDFLKLRRIPYSSRFLKRLEGYFEEIKK